MSPGEDFGEEMVLLPWSWKSLHKTAVSSLAANGAAKINQDRNISSRGINVKGEEGFMHTSFPSHGHGYKRKFENLSLQSYNPKGK